jgi:hypothetical protein
MLYDVFARMEDANAPSPVLAKGLKTFVAFEPSRFPTFAAVIGKQPALAFVICEANDNSADAPTLKPSTKAQSGATKLIAFYTVRKYKIAAWQRARDFRPKCDADHSVRSINR